MECLTIPEDGSLVRVFHAVPNAPAVDVYVNDILAFRNITFRQFTNYVPLTSGQYTVRLFAAGTDEPALLTAELTVPLGEIYTATATGNIDDLQLLVLDDSTPTVPSDNESSFRVVHLAPNAPAVNLQLDNIPVIQNISFREMTPYALVPPNTYIVTVHNSLTNAFLLTFRIQLRPHYISTIYLIGDLPSLSAIQSIDGGTYLCNN